MQHLEDDDASVCILHEHDFVGGFLADRLLVGLVQPNGERLPGDVNESL